MLYFSCVCVSIRMRFAVEVVVTVRGRHESARAAVCLIECSLSVFDTDIQFSHKSIVLISHAIPQHDL